MSKVKDAATLAMLLVAIVFSAGLLTLPEYSSAGLDVSGLSSAAPAGETYSPNVTSPPVSSVAPPAVTPGAPLHREGRRNAGEDHLGGGRRCPPATQRKQPSHGAPSTGWTLVHTGRPSRRCSLRRGSLPTTRARRSRRNSRRSPETSSRVAGEQRGAEGVGRTLPEDYFFFEGDGLRNHFRKTYEKTGATWDWSLPDPYGEAAV